MPDPGPGAMTFYYTNQQSARLMFYHDHSYGITRLNVYAGEAAGYILRDQVEVALINAGIVPVDEIPLVIQDKTFVPDNTAPITNMWGTFPSQLAFQDPTWDINKWGGPGSLWYPHVYMPLENPSDRSGWNPWGRWAYGPWFWPPAKVPYGPVPNPYYNGGIPNEYGIVEPYWIPGVPSISTPGEAWFDTPVINGEAYPYLEVEPKAYRFRILNAADDRFWNLQLYVATSGIVQSIKVTNPGSGYKQVPKVTITDTTGQGYGATAKAVIDSTTGAVTEINMISVGSNFTSTSNVVVTISPPPVGGTRATATAVVYMEPTEVGMVPAVPAAGYPEEWPGDGRPGGLPDPAYIGPSFIQIGNEGGFLPVPYIVPNRPVGWNSDPGTFDFGVVNQWALGLAPAERADVIVDFSAFAGKTLILYNDAPAPVPANDPRNDYYTSDPDQVDSGGAPSTLPGYGPNTRTLMQIRVKNTTPAAPFNLTALENEFAADTATVITEANGFATSGVFAASQDPIIVPQSAYSSAYGTTFKDIWANIFDNSLTFTPLGGTTLVTIPFQAKAIHDEMGESFDDYGRMQAVLGLELPRSQAGLQNFILYNFPDPPTEVFRFSIKGTLVGTLDDGTQIWKVTHNGVDTHPIHFHEMEVQVINRVAWDNNIRWPDPNELGWKETVKFNPLQDTIIAMRPYKPDVPFDLPNSIRLIDPTRPEGTLLKGFTLWEAGQGRPAFDIVGEPINIYNHYVNYGWEYVWHCHILAHEEMDMMRSIAVAVPPKPPFGLTVTPVDNGVRLDWVDNSLSETHFTIQKAEDVSFLTGLTTFTVGANVNTYIDTNITGGKTYYYRVVATNVVGDTWDYSDPEINEGAVGFPTMTVHSVPSNIATTGTPLGDIHAAVRGSENEAIYHESFISASGNWTGWSALPNGSTVDTPAVIVVAEKEYFVVRGSDGSSLWFGSRNLATGTFSSWTWIDGSTPSAPTLVTDGVRLALVVRGSDDRVYYRFFDTVTQVWGDWNVVPTGTTSEKPAAALTSNKLHLVVRGITPNSNIIWHGTVDLANKAFSGWKPVDGSTPSAPILVPKQTSNDLCLIVRGENNLLYINTWNGFVWQGWTAVPSGATPLSPAAVVLGDTLHFVVVGMDGYSLWYNSMNLVNGTIVGWMPMNGSTLSAPTLAR
ncbi:MAG: multicopper oxidase domain-containing protein [Nitrososphaeria archaeon]